MLRDRKVIADSIPFLRIVVTQTNCDGAVRLREILNLVFPGSIVGQRPVNKHKREAAAGFLICHVIAIDLDCIYAIWEPISVRQMAGAIKSWLSRSALALLSGL